MGLPYSDSSADYRIATAGLRDATTDIPEAPWYAGGFQGLFTGAVSGLASVGRMAGDLGVAAGKGRMIEARGFAPWQEEEAARAIEQSKVEVRPIGDASFQAMQKWAEPDPAYTGFLGRTTHGVARGFTIVGLGSMAGGPYVGAALLGATEAHSTYRSLEEQGVNESTRLKVAAVQGVTAFAGAALPMTVPASAARSLGLLSAEAAAAGKTTLAGFYSAAASSAQVAGGTWARRIGTGIAANNLMGMSSRGLTSEILENAGYADMAKQYQVLDAEGIVADTILGAAFGSWHEVGEFRKTLREAEKPGPLMVDHALEMRVHAEESRGAVGIPVDAETAMLDVELQARAREAFVKGNDFDILPEEAARIVSNSLLDPVKVQLMNEFSKVLYDQFGVRPIDPPPIQDIFAPTGEPIRRVTPPEMPGGEAKSVLAANLDPTHLDMLDQIAAHNPDLKITLPDGTVVDAANARPAMEEAMAKELKTADLFDTAVACFLRGIV